MHAGKDASIADMLARLQLEKQLWVIVDHWDADRCAIGIARADNCRILVYISTYNASPGRYYYECEVPAGSEMDAFQVCASGNDVSFDALLTVLRRHLGCESPASDAQ